MSKLFHVMNDFSSFSDFQISDFTLSIRKEVARRSREEEEEEEESEGWISSRTLCSKKSGKACTP